ncbi:MAG: peptide chain release factor-like protein [Nitrospinae bacterium]|nr:peptide chain release factor-like protein [Nitrospinota bacterium]
MASLGIREEDLAESFVRSGGKGGQKVNKTSTCVYLKHLPTGMEVKCQKDRSQALNRYHARAALCQKIEAMLSGEESEEAKRIKKMRKQKLRRTKRAKEKMHTQEPEVRIQDS